MIGFYIFHFVNNKFDLNISYVYFGLIVQLLNLKGLKKAFSFQQKYSLVRGRAIAKGDA
jgi:hypothetical protein